MDFRADQLVGAIKKRCRRGGLPFDIDNDWLATRMRHGVCEVTGLPFVMDVVNGRPTPFSPSVDRIDPQLGYVKTNCRVVLHALNIAMSDWGLDVVKAIAAALLTSSGCMVVGEWPGFATGGRVAARQHMSDSGPS